MQPKDLLHSVNNQLEIIVSAAHLLKTASDPKLAREYSDLIVAAAFRVSALLGVHFDISKTGDSRRLQLPCTVGVGPTVRETDKSHPQLRRPL